MLCNSFLECAKADGSEDALLSAQHLYNRMHPKQVQLLCPVVVVLCFALRFGDDGTARLEGKTYIVSDVLRRELHHAINCGVWDGNMTRRSDMTCGVG